MAVMDDFRNSSAMGKGLIVAAVLVVASLLVVAFSGCSQESPGEACGEKAPVDAGVLGDRPLAREPELAPLDMSVLPMDPLYTEPNPFEVFENDVFDEDPLGRRLSKRGMLA